MDDFDSWHVKLPMTTDRWARLLALLSGIPRRKRRDVFEVLAYLNREVLAEFLALLLDRHVDNFSMCGAVVAIGEFLEMMG